MKRMHLHVSVDQLDKSILFYSTLFGAKPTVVKGDYAKWQLEDPRVNFAISERQRLSGIDHVGIQVENGEELAELAGRLKAAGEATFDQEATTCCYAKSDKTWVTDPSGLRWETFYTFDDATHYGEEEPVEEIKATGEAARCSATVKSDKAACC